MRHPAWRQTWRASEHLARCMSLARVVSKKTLPARYFQRSCGDGDAASALYLKHCPSKELHETESSCNLQFVPEDLRPGGVWAVTHQCSALQAEVTIVQCSAGAGQQPRQRHAVAGIHRPAAAWPIPPIRHLHLCAQGICCRFAGLLDTCILQMPI